MPSIEEIAEAMYKMVERDAGSKKYKPSDLSKAMIAHFGDEVDKKACKKAIQEAAPTILEVFNVWDKSLYHSHMLIHGKHV